ncbi:MAG: hypothetical protein K2Y31_06935 [Burkholderiales bacterium]|nr:hypothetical protein [Burkholderiales bacterium]
MKWRRIILLSCLAMLSAKVFPYELETHSDMSQAALQLSILNQPSLRVLTDLGLEESINVARQFPDSNGAESSITLLFRNGARSEDNFPRPRHHFYDPVNNRPLTVGGIAVGRTSPDWALEDKGQIGGVLGIGAQEFSLADARGYLYKALTSTSKTDRRKNFGLTFQTIGQVIHHVQDMAQPQHVRNDSHLDTPLTNPSLYEKYTDQNGVRNVLPFGGYVSAYSSADSATFNAGRNFWHTPEGKGLADFTNRNFVSAGTNFDKPGLFPSPVRDESKKVDMDIQQLCANASPPCPNPSLTGLITFYGNTVEDRFTGQSTNNPFASSLSIFDADLQKAAGNPLNQPKLFTLNQFNFALAHGFLIPRAVGYSAGLINYFFRGKLDFKKDEQDPTKFRIINLGPEAMNGRFALYYDAKDGNRYPVAVDPADPNRDPNDPNSWRLTVAALAPSAPNANLSAPVSFGAPVNDESPQSPKVANEYMLVFNGNMGEEREDAANGVVGAVAAKAVVTPYNGVLYLIGANAAGQRVSFRADQSGTRIVNFPEFHPLREIGIPQIFPALAKGYIIKQVAFTEHLSGFSYDVLATTVGVPQFGDLATSWVKNPVTNTFESVGGVAWTAKSANPQIGEFSFRAIVPQFNPAAATLEYTRSFKDAAGNPQTSSSVIALPAVPGTQTYTILPQGLAYVSGDGLSVSGFSKSISSGNSTLKEHYDLRITLAEVPSVAFAQTGQSPFISNVLINQVSPVITGSVSTTATCESPPRTITGTMTTTGRVFERGGDIEERRNIDYFNGALRSYRSIERNRVKQSFQSTAAALSSTSADGACRWTYVLRKGESSDILSVETEQVFSDASLVHAAMSQPSNDPVVFSPPNSTWDYFYEGLSPAPPFSFPLNPPPSPGGRVVVDRALTDRMQDAISRRTSGFSTVGGNQFFRGFDITGKPYVADASPIGEVFFATSDLSRVIHEPKRGPKVVIPPGVVKLLAAVWL